RAARPHLHSLPTRRSSALLGDHPTGVDDDDPVAEVLGLVHEVGDEQDGHPAPTALVDERPGLAAGLGVQAGGELVEDRDARVAEDRKSTRLNSSHVKISYA